MNVGQLMRLVRGGAMPPAIVTRPSIVGTPTEDETLTSVDATWAHGPILTRVHQWYWSTTGVGGWSDIEGATDASYKPDSGMVGRWLRLGEIAVNAAGASDEAYSDAAGPVASEASPDYVVSDDDELDAAISALASTGGVIALQSDGVFAADREFTAAPTDRLIFRTHNFAGTRAKLGNIRLKSVVRLTFKNLDFGNNDRVTNCVSLTSGIADDCEFIGNELYGKPYNPATDDYSLPVGSGGDAPANNTNRGVRASTGARFHNCRFIDNYFHDLNDGFKGTQLSGDRCAFVGNTLDMIYTDAVHFSYNPLYPLTNFTFAWNVITRRICISTDYNAPHGDAFQVTMNSPADDVRIVGWRIIGNTIWDRSDARGRWQGRLISDLDGPGPDGGGRYVHFVNKWNLRVSNGGDSQGLIIDRSEGGYTWGDIIARQDPGGTNAETSKISIAGRADWMSNFAGASVTEQITLTGAATTERNVSMAINSKSAHEANFVGPFDPTSIQEVWARYKIAAGSTLADLRDAVDYENRTIDATLERPFLAFINVDGAEPNTPTWSNWSMLMGGGAGQAYECDVPYEIADDASGTNSTGELPAGSGVVDEYKYIRVKPTSSASALGEVSANFKVRGFDNLFTLQTAA